jgi:hypothetical protein
MEIPRFSQYTKREKFSTDLLKNSNFAFPNIVTDCKPAERIMFDNV